MFTHWISTLIVYILISHQVVMQTSEGQLILQSVVFNNFINLTQLFPPFSYRGKQWNPHYLTPFSINRQFLVQLVGKWLPTTPRTTKSIHVLSSSHSNCPNFHDNKIKVLSHILSSYVFYAIKSILNKLNVRWKL